MLRIVNADPADPCDVAAAAPRGDPTAWVTHVDTLFVVGAPRSGTTWVRRLLLDLPGVVGGVESHFFTALGPALVSYDLTAASTRRIGLSQYVPRDELVGEIRRLWGRWMGPLVTAAPDARVLVEKTPGHALLLDQIVDVLPRSRFVHVVRDGRAVVASLLAAAEGWGKEWAPRRTRHAARLWVKHVEAARAAGARLGPERYLEVRYESLHADAAARLREIARFAGIEASDEQVALAVRRHDAENVRAGQGGDDWAAEPKGFLGGATPEGWRRQLTWSQRATVWRHARHVLRSLGYR